MAGAIAAFPAVMTMNTILSMVGAVANLSSVMAVYAVLASSAGGRARSGGARASPGRGKCSKDPPERGFTF